MEDRKAGLKKVDKQSDQKQPLRKKGVQSVGKEGEETGEERQGKEGCGLEKLWSIVSPLLRHSLPFIQQEREDREQQDARQTVHRLVNI